MRPGVRVGVDVGTVRVGVAVSDPAGVLATPAATLARDIDGGSDLVALAQLVAERAAIEVIVGLPLHLSGAESAASTAARGYAAHVAERVAPLPVRLVDERLTTVDAHRNLRDSGVEGRRQREIVDQAAAVLILQTALDAERTSGRPPGVPVGARRRKARTKDGHR